MKRIKEIFIYFLLIICISPLNVLAYSNKIIASGKSVGIEIHSKGVIVVGFYDINNSSPKKDSDIRLGDNIIKINNNYINNINEMLKEIDKNKSDGYVKVTLIRNDKEYDTILKLVKDSNNIYKTGLYVKDTINGIGTLTYIDPSTGMYGALGHEIIDKNTLSKINIGNGNIYKSNVISINKSKNGNAGEKNAEILKDTIIGSINKNTTSGIFGNYKNSIDDTKLYEVAEKDEIKLGNAKLLTVLSDNIVKEYDININSINKKSLIKNISFTVIDNELLSNTGGIVQGMSGSPIIQDDKIIGAVTHVIVDNPTKGYGIFITTMLEEMEKK